MNRRKGMWSKGGRKRSGVSRGSAFDSGSFRREIGLFTGISLVAGMIIGSGIYYLGAYVLERTHMNMGLALLCWIIGGGISVLGGLCFAELGASMPVAGGLTVYLSRAYSPALGFLNGFCLFLLNGSGSNAAMAIAFFTAFSGFFPMEAMTVKVLAVCLILFLTGLNLRGVRLASLFQNFTMAARIIPLILIILLGLFMGQQTPDLSLCPANLGWEAEETAVQGDRLGMVGAGFGMGVDQAETMPGRMAAMLNGPGRADASLQEAGTAPQVPRPSASPEPPAPQSAKPSAPQDARPADYPEPPDVAAPGMDVSGMLGIIAFGTLASLWAFEGWANLNSVASEMKNPRRDLPLAIILSLASIMVVFVLFNYAIFKVLSVEEMKGMMDAGNIYLGNEVAYRLMGSTGRWIVVIGMAIGIVGTLNGGILAYPRIYYAMSKQGYFPKCFGRLHPKYGVPHTALTVQALVSICLVLTRNLEQLTNLVVFTSALFNLFAVGAVFIFRRKYPKMERSYKVWGGTATILVTLVLYGILVLNTMVNDPVNSLISLAVPAVGYVVYLYFRKKNGGAEYAGGI